MADRNVTEVLQDGGEDASTIIDTVIDDTATSGGGGYSATKLFETFAKKLGDAANKFKVADGEADDDAVNKGQLDEVDKKQPILSRKDVGTTNQIVLKRHDDGAETITVVDGTTVAFTLKENITGAATLKLGNLPEKPFKTKAGNDFTPNMANAGDFVIAKVVGNEFRLENIIRESIVRALHGDAQDVTVTWENEDGSTTIQTHPNLAKMKTSMHIHEYNTSVDDIRTPGLYTSSSWVDSPAEGTYGSLSVIPTNGSATDVVQRFVANDGKVYQRFWNDAAPGWPAHWVETVGVTAVQSGNPNDYKKAGRYHSSGWDNTPDGSTYGDLEVYYINGATNDVGQKYTSSADKVFVRFYNDANDTWTTWKRLWTSDATIMSRPGYMKLPNGFIMQWGVSGDIASGDTETITLPIAFPNGALVPTGSIASGSGGNYGGVNIGLPNNSQITVGHYNNGDNSASIFWMVIGH